MVFVRFKRQKPCPIYGIAFCSKPDISTKFDEYDKTFNSIAEAKQFICNSGANDWDRAIKRNLENTIDPHENAWKIDDAWLVIEKRK